MSSAVSEVTPANELKDQPPDGRDRLGDLLAEDGLELPGHGLAGGGGPEHGDQVVSLARVPPPVDEVAHQQLTPAAGRDRAQVGGGQVHGHGRREQPRLGVEVAHDHRGVHAGPGGHRC